MKLSPWEKSGSPQMVKNRVTKWSSTPIPSYISDRNENSHTKTCVQMFIAIVFMTDKMWKQPTSPSTDENKLNVA